MRDPWLDKLASVLVQYSTAVRRGEIVSIVGPLPGEPLVVALYREIILAGAHPVILMAPEECTEILYEHAGPEQLGFLNPLELREVEVADVAIHVLATENTRALTQVDPGKQAQ